MKAETMARVMRVYEGSDGEATKALYAELERRGPIGNVAVNLFRAQKTSSRAKVYRGRGARGWREESYRRKQWSMENLAEALGRHGDALGLRWGWALDPDQAVHRHILYVDLPTGQISWHTGERAPGPDYPHPWDEARGTAAGRICSWVAGILDMVECV